MCADHAPTGSACLLRVAGVPAAALADLGNTALFDRIRAHLDDELDYRWFAGTGPACRRRTRPASGIDALAAPPGHRDRAGAAARRAGRRPRVPSAGGCLGNPGHRGRARREPAQRRRSRRGAGGRRTRSHRGDRHRAGAPGGLALADRHRQSGHHPHPHQHRARDRRRDRRAAGRATGLDGQAAAAARGLPAATDGPLGVQADAARVAGAGGAGRPGARTGGLARRRACGAPGGRHPGRASVPGRRRRPARRLVEHDRPALDARRPAVLLGRSPRRAEVRADPLHVRCGRGPARAGAHRAADVCCPGTARPPPGTGAR